MFPAAITPIPMAVYAVDIGIALIILWAIMLFVYTRRVAIESPRDLSTDSDDYTIKVELLNQT